MVRLSTYGGLVVLSHTTEPVGPVGQVVVVLVALAIGGLIALVGVGYLQTYSRLRGTDPVDIRRLGDASGEVELTGTVQPHEETSTTPFTRTECVAHEWTVREYRGGGSGSTWRTLDSGEARHPFRLADGTGTVLVDPNGGTLELLSETTVEVGAEESPPPAVGAYLGETEAVDREHGRERKYVERHLEPGEDVQVFGPVRRLAHSADMPGGADAVIGLDDPDRGFTVGEDGLSTLVDQIRTDSMRFTITAGDERESERHLLKRGLAMTGFGVVFALLPLVFVVVL